eukprot:378381-Prymnesium_polylepis.1
MPVRGSNPRPPAAASSSSVAAPCPLSLVIDRPCAGAADNGLGGRERPRARVAVGRGQERGAARCWRPDAVRREKGCLRRRRDGGAVRPGTAGVDRMDLGPATRACNDSWCCAGRLFASFLYFTL